jgi:glutamate synthase domain-containing protein 2
LITMFYTSSIFSVGQFTTVLFKFIIYVCCGQVDKSTYEFLVYSYCGAQIFEIYGLGKEVVDLAFCGSVSNIGGLTFDEVRNIITITEKDIK